MQVPRKPLSLRIKVVLCALLATAVLFALSIGSTADYGRSPAGRRMASAHLRVLAAAEAANAYRAKSGRFPSNSHELLMAVKGVGLSPSVPADWIDPNGQNIVDSWGTPLTIRATRSAFAVIAAGPDQQFGTDDDIIEVGKWSPETPFLFSDSPQTEPTSRQSR